MTNGATFWHVDAFTDTPFKGNPASVTLFPTEPQNQDNLQVMASEMNLPINVFIWPLKEDRYFARYFTPEASVPVSGHGSLSASHVLLSEGLVPKGSQVNLETLGGPVTATSGKNGIRLSMPAFETSPIEVDKRLFEKLGVKDCVSARLADLGPSGKDLVLELPSEDDVAGYKPDSRAIIEACDHALLLTATSSSPDADYVLRYFAPKFGLNEDWVTGLANSSMIPFWSKRFGKPELIGHQVSRRPGFVYGEYIDGAVFQSGHAVTVLRGNWNL